MLRSLILPISIYRLQTKMHTLEIRIKKMESRNYLDLQGRKDVAQMKKMLCHLHDQESALHFSFSM
jgi:hypothetical protein